jgi:hypothetical protein
MYKQSELVSFTGSTKYYYILALVVALSFGFEEVRLGVDWGGEDVEDLINGCNSKV